MASERNTVLAVWNAFFAHMKRLEGTAGGGSTLAIRKVAEGDSTLDGWPVPHLAIKPEDLEPTSRTDDNKLKTCTLHLKVVSQITAAGGGTAEILAKCAQIDDQIEAFAKPPGAAGFECNKWGFLFWHTAEHGNLVAAESKLKFSVVTARGAN